MSLLGLQDGGFHGLTFTPEEAENIAPIFQNVGAEPRIAERPAQLNMERRPLLLKAPQGLDRMTAVWYPGAELGEGNKGEAAPPPPPPPPPMPAIDQADRDAADKARKTAGALAAMDNEGAAEDEAGADGGDEGISEKEGEIPTPQTRCAPGARTGPGVIPARLG